MGMMNRFADVMCGVIERTVDTHRYRIHDVDVFQAIDEITPRSLFFLFASLNCLRHEIGKFI